MSADGDSLALAPTLDRIEVHELGSDKRPGSFFYDGRGFALSPDGRLFAVNRRNDALLAPSAEGRYLAAAHADRVRVWDLETGEPILDRLVAGEPATLVLGDEDWWLVTVREERVQTGTRSERQQSRYSLIDLRSPGTGHGTPTATC